MRIAGSALTKVATAVQGYVRYEMAETVPNDDILRNATKHDPQLMAQLAKFKVRVRASNKSSSVLVCDKEGTRGFLEDSGCTGPLDENLWHDERPKPCEFVIDLEKVCNPPTASSPVSEPPTSLPPQPVSPAPGIPANSAPVTKM